MNDTGTATEPVTEWWEGLCGPVDRTTRKALRPLGEQTIYLPGAVIVAEGERADRFSLIVEGTVDVEVDGEVVNQLRAGEFFGEVALLYKRPKGPSDAPESIHRTATVRARVITRVHSLNQAELMSFMDASPKAATHISRAAVGRLAVLHR